MFFDLQTRDGRLTKQSTKADFRLADSDDFFGFSEEKGTLTTAQMIIGLVIGLPMLWVLLVIWGSF